MGVAKNSDRDHKNNWVKETVLGLFGWTGRLKVRDVKMTDHRNRRDENARHENVEHENAGQKIAGHENRRHETFHIHIFV